MVVRLLRQLADAVADGAAVASATVVDTARSVPRHAGAKMLVFRDGRSAGTVGGGEMEARVIAEAQHALTDGRCRLLSYRLVDPRRGDPGVCGGDVRIFVEPHMPKPSLVVMGYGHVGRAVVQMGRWLGYRTVAVDDRPGISGDLGAEGSGGAAETDGLDRAGVAEGAGGAAETDGLDRAGVAEGAAAIEGAGGVEGSAGVEGAGGADELILGGADDLLSRHALEADASVVLVTRNVDVDVAALPALLGTAAGYIGVMGSNRRWATTKARLIEAGVAPGALERVRAPIGIEIGAETPEEIAVSIMAEVVAHRRA